MSGPLSLPVQLLCPEPAQPALAQAVALLAEALTGWKTQNPAWSPALHFDRVETFLNAQAAPALPSHALCAAIDDELEATAAEDAQPVAVTMPDCPKTWPGNIEDAFLLWRSELPYQGATEKQQQAFRDGWLWHSRATATSSEQQSPQPAAVIPVKLTKEEIEAGGTRIRWVTAIGIHGRPTTHDMREYLKNATETLQCVCVSCKAAAQPVALEPLTDAKSVVQPTEVRRLAELVLHAVDNRSAKDWTLMHLDLSEAAEIARLVVAEGLARDGSSLEQAS